MAKAKEAVKTPPPKRENFKDGSIVFSLKLPMAGYRKVKGASKKCGLTMQEFIRRSVASAVFGLHYDHD